MNYVAVLDYAHITYALYPTSVVWPRVCTNLQKSHWPDAQEKSFLTLKDFLYTDLVLPYPPPGEKFILGSDASRYDLEDVLSQVAKGSDKGIGYYPLILSNPESNFCAKRCDFLGMVEYKTLPQKSVWPNFTLKTLVAVPQTKMLE